MMSVKVPRFRLSVNGSILKKALKGLFFPNDRQDYIRLFEDKFKNYVGAKEAVAVGSATIAEYALLKNIDLEEGSEIMVAAYTLPNVINMILCAGYKPVFVDIELNTFNFDIEDLKKKICPGVKAILVTHLYGYAGNMGAIAEIAKAEGLMILEDCSQATGTLYNGRSVGTFGKASYFSFSTYKNITTFGGGLIVTDDSRLAEKIRAEVRRYKEPAFPYFIKNIGKAAILWFFTTPFIFKLFTYHVLKLLGKTTTDSMSVNMLALKAEAMTEVPASMKLRYSHLQAMVGLAQIDRIEERNRERIKNADILNEGLKKDIDRRHRYIYLYYPYITSKGWTIKERLFDEGIDSTCGSLRPCHTLEIFKNFHSPCKNADYMHENLIFLPLYPPLPKEALETMIKVIKGVEKGGVEGELSLEGGNSGRLVESS